MREKKYLLSCSQRQAYRKKNQKGLKILIHFHLGHVLPKPILIVHFFQSNADNTDSIPVKIHERKLVKTRENYF